jgi:hypothetical protein
MKKLALSIIVIATLLVFIQIEGRACTCDLPQGNLTLKQQVKKARKQARAVFIGKVVEIRRDPQAYIVGVKFQVQNAWKGTFPYEVTVDTGLGSGDCGYRFEIGEIYLVYAYGSNESSLVTNICQRTAPLVDASADIKVLGKGKSRTKG